MKNKKNMPKRIIKVNFLCIGTQIPDNGVKNFLAYFTNDGKCIKRKCSK